MCACPPCCAMLQPEEHGDRASNWVTVLTCTVLINYVEMSLELGLFEDMSSQLAAHWCVCTCMPWRACMPPC